MPSQARPPRRDPCRTPGLLGAPGNGARGQVENERPTAPQDGVSVSLKQRKTRKLGEYRTRRNTRGGLAASVPASLGLDPTPAGFPPFQAVFRLFWNARFRFDPTARAADRAVLIELR